MAAQEFNFAPKFAHSGEFSAQILYFWKEMSRQAEMSPCHDGTAPIQLVTTW